MADTAEIRTNLNEKDDFSTRFYRDGVLIVENAFTEQEMDLIEAAYQGNLDNPSPLAQHLYAESGGTFIQSLEDSSKKPAFQAMFQGTPVVDIARNVFGSGGVWYFHDQLFSSKGPSTSRCGARPGIRTHHIIQSTEASSSSSGFRCKISSKTMRLR